MIDVGVLMSYQLIDSGQGHRPIAGQTRTGDLTTDHPISVMLDFGSKFQCHCLTPSRHMKTTSLCICILLGLSLAPLAVAGKKQNGGKAAHSAGGGGGGHGARAGLSSAIGGRGGNSARPSGGGGHQ